MTQSIEQFFGLVLVGGKSTRMGKDKAIMVYHDKPQYQVSYELLASVCSKVFISVRNDQFASKQFGSLPQIIDDKEFEGKGPMSGILSAMKKYPNVSWIVLACDLPFVSKNTLNFLIKRRNLNTIGTAYKSQTDELPEPLCAIWEKNSFIQISELFKSGIHCPRKILIRLNAHLIDQQSTGELDNINNLSEVSEVLARLKNK